MAQEAAVSIAHPKTNPSPDVAPVAPKGEKAKDVRPDPHAGKSKGVRFFHHHIKPILYVAIVLLSVRSSIADWNDVPTGSMRPCILEGDRIFVNKLAYDLKVPFTTWHVAEWGNPQRGEVVVFFSPDNGIRMVKRVVGVPGDVLELRNNVLILNGNVANYGALSMDVVNQIPAKDRARYRYGTETTSDGVTHPVLQIPSVINQYRSFGPITVPPGKYFLMGDNRDNSGDSRVWGFADRKQIVGRAVGIAASLDPERSYAPRWDRFFKGFPKGSTEAAPATAPAGN